MRGMGEGYTKLARSIKEGGVDGAFAAQLKEDDIKDDVPNAMLRRRVLEVLASRRRPHGGVCAW